MIKLECDGKKGYRCVELEGSGKELTAEFVLILIELFKQKHMFEVVSMAYKLALDEATSDLINKMKKEGGNTNDQSI